MWLGDDFHHNGAFRLSYAFEYAFELESAKKLEQFRFTRYDTYDWYLALGPLSNVNAKYFHGEIPTWNDFVEHPDYDAFWKRQTMVPHLREVRVPTLNVAGWWDQEDFYGPLAIYEALEKQDPRNLNFLVVGPWNHGGWDGGTGRQARPDRVRRRDRKVLPRPGPGAVLRVLPQGQGQARPAGGADVRGGHEPLAAVGRVAAGAGRPDEEPLLRAGRDAVLRPARRPGLRRRVRRVPLGSGAPGALPASADPDHLFSPRLEVADLARRGPALRVGPPGRALLGDGGRSRRT